MLMKNKAVTECAAQTPDARLRPDGRARTASGRGRSGHRNPPRRVVDLNNSGTPPRESGRLFWNSPPE